MVLDARQTKLCDNAKAANITIYRVQVNTGSERAAILRQPQRKFYLVTSFRFKDIGTSLSKLRVPR